jgi:hypothetical protein
MFESLAQRGEGKMSKPMGLVLLVGAMFVVAIWVLARYMA